MIEDEALRDVFRTEAEERLQALEACLLRFEEDAGDRDALEALFREAHTLKGAAAMIGLDDLGALAHCFEDVLGEARRGRAALPPAAVDALYEGLDAMRALVRAAVTGERADVRLAAVLGALRGGFRNVHGDPAPREPTRELALPRTAAADRQLALPEPAVASREWEFTPPPGLALVRGRPQPRREDHDRREPPRRVQAVEEDADDDEAGAQDAPATPPGHTRREAYRIETVRVDPTSLDALLTHAGELTVTKLRIQQRLSELDDALALVEDVTRESGLEHLFAHAAVADAAVGRKLESVLARRASRLERLRELLRHVKENADGDYARLDQVSSEIESGIRNVRLLPLNTVFQNLPRLVRDLAKEQEKELEFRVVGGDTQADKRVLEEIKDPLMHMVRNAVDHGLESPEEREAAGKSPVGTVLVRAYRAASEVVIEVSDDGRGLDTDAIARKAVEQGLRRAEDVAAMSDEEVHMLVFTPGFSTRSEVTSVSGRGVGMDVVKTSVENLKGTIGVTSFPGIGCTIRVRLPVTLATARVLIVRAGDVTCALPVEYVESARVVAPDDVFILQGQPVASLGGEPTSLVHLADVLERPGSGDARRMERPSPVIVVTAGDARVGLVADALVDEQEVLLKPFGGLLKRVRNVAGATILGTGEVCMILNPHDIVKAVHFGRVWTQAGTRAVDAPAHRRTILLVDDSIMTRTQMKRVLEGAGYAVVTAVDGADAFTKLAAHPCDAVVSDVEMPHVDGITLTRRLRQDGRFAELPIILVTTLASDADKRRGLDAGADAYLPKPAFDKTTFLDLLGRFC